MPDEPTLGEVVRTLARIERDLGARLDELNADNHRRYAELNATIGILVTRDMYEAHRTAMQEDIAQLREELKTERERKAADRRMVVGALIAAGLSLVVAIVAAALLLALGLKP